MEDKRNNSLRQNKHTSRYLSFEIEMLLMNIFFVLWLVSFKDFKCSCIEWTMDRVTNEILDWSGVVEQNGHKKGVQILWTACYFVRNGIFLLSPWRNSVFWNGLLYVDIKEKFC